MYRLGSVVSVLLTSSLLAFGCDDAGSGGSASASAAASAAATAAVTGHAMTGMSGHAMSGKMMMSAGPAPTTGAAVGADGVISVTVTDKGFEPARIEGTAGKPVTLRITRKTDATCATAINVKTDPPQRAELPLNEAVDVTVTPGAVGEIAFACDMDHIGGVIAVR